MEILSLALFFVPNIVIGFIFGFCYVRCMSEGYWKFEILVVASLSFYVLLTLKEYRSMFNTPDQVLLYFVTIVIPVLLVVCFEVYDVILVEIEKERS